MLKNMRLHGHPPYTVVAVHGGPGGVGEARPFAEELSKKYGVVEPFLMAESLEGQIADLKQAIEMHAQTPVVLISHSYGAMLSYIFAAKYPALVKKLIMISSGLLEAKDAEGINATRLSRLTPAQREKLEAARTAYKQARGGAKKQAFVELFTAIKEADAYNLIPHKSDLAVIRPSLYDSVWDGMQTLRNSGELVAYGKDIQCPVIAIHGDYDPRPAQSIRNSLDTHVKDCEFILLKSCGHYPWYEKEAQSAFYERLLQSLKQ